MVQIVLHKIFYYKHLKVWGCY